MKAQDFKKFEVVNFDGKEMMIIEKISSELFDSKDGEMVFDPKALEKRANFLIRVLGGRKKINYDLEAFVRDNLIYVVSINMKLDHKQIESNIQSNLDLAKEESKLIIANSGKDKTNSLLLPKDQKIDPNRLAPPEVKNGKLLNRGHHEVKRLWDLQTELLNHDVLIDGTNFKKISADANLFLVKEDLSETDKILELKIQSLDFSKSEPAFRFSLSEEGNRKKQSFFKVKVIENLKNSSELFKLVEGLTFPPEKRPPFQAKCDLEKIYDENTGEVKIKSIILKKIL